MAFGAVVLAIAGAFATRANIRYTTVTTAYFPGRVGRLLFDLRRIRFKPHDHNV